MLAMETPANIESNASVGRWGLRLFLWAFVAKELFFLVVLQGLLYLLPLFDLLYQVDGEAWGLREWFDLLFAVSAGVGVVGSGICAWGLFSYARAEKTRWNSSAMLAAQLAWALSLTWQVVNLLVYRLALTRELVSGTFLADLQTWGFFASAVAESFAIALIAFVGLRESRRLGRLPAKGLFTGLCFALGFGVLISIAHRVIRLVFADWPVAELGFWRSMLNITSMVDHLAILLLFGLSLVLQLRHLGGVPEVGLGAELRAGDRFGMAPWPSVRRGLSVYRGGLIAKIWVVLLGLGLLFLVAIGGSREGALAVLVILSIASLFTTGWMTLGLMGYAQVPLESGGRGPVVFALVMIFVSVLLEIYGLVLVFQLYSRSLDSVYDAAAQMPYVEGFGQAIGIAGLLSLLCSFRQVGLHAGAPTVGRRVGVVATLLSVVAVAAIFIRALAAERMLPGGLAVVFGVGTLVCAIFALVMYFRMLKDLRRAIGAFGRAEVFD